MDMDEIGSVAELNDLLLAEPRGVVLDFWGTWCQPCRTLRPHLERMADERADAWRFVAVHTENNADLVDAYGVQATPTLIYMKTGTEVHRSAGAATLATIDAALRAHS